MLLSLLQEWHHAKHALAKHITTLLHAAQQSPAYMVSAVSAPPDLSPVQPRKAAGLVVVFGNPYGVNGHFVEPDDDEPDGGCEDCRAGHGCQATL